MPVFLIRHAHAGSRSAWEGDDALRPLSKKGRGQSELLAQRLASVEVGRVLSSPSTRCIETAEPIAEAQGRTIEVREDLAEGADPDAARELLVSVASENPVMVGHGDLIPRLLGRFLADGMEAPEIDVCQKGSMWTVELEGGRAVRATYLPPLSTAKL